MNIDYVVDIKECIKADAPFHLQAPLIDILEGWEKAKESYVRHGRNDGFDLACRILANQLGNRDLADQLHALKPAD